jgi:hypothetical protein
MFNALLVIARDGRLLGRRRKLMPTHSERVYWGMGDALDIRVFSPSGRAGEGWTAIWARSGPSRARGGATWSWPSGATPSKNSVFVISSSWYLPERAIPDDLRDVMTYNLATGPSEPEPSDPLRMAWR